VRPVALGVDAVVVMTPFEDFKVRVQRGGARPVGEQLELARWAASQFRFGIDMGASRVVRAARELVRLLDSDGLVFGRGAALLDDDFGSGSRLSSPFDARDPFPTAFGGIAARLEEELLAGRLIVERQLVAPLTERRDQIELELPPLPPARRDSTTRSFEVRFVDEVGKAITGIDAEFTADGAQMRATNAAGVALLEGVQSTSANVAIVDPDALSKVLDPRWETFRPGKPPKESNATEVVFRGSALGPFALKAELPNTVVIKPPLGKLLVELWDKTGRARHANRTYQITGPQSFEGTTDDDGRLLHEDVFPGDYQLSLALEFFEEDAPDRAIDIVDSALVTLAAESEPQVRLVGAVPRSILARLHMFFNTNKTFLLPTALPSVQKLRRLYAENAPCQLLVVGHADTKASTAYNDKLSLERAQATIAYLADDVEGWFKFYGLDIDAPKRWGKVEDHLMIMSMPGFVSKPKGEKAVEWYQRTRGLEVDGTAGKETRRALIEEYMSLDGASLADFVGDIDATAHGCGENFPLADDGETLDTAPQDEKRDPIDRRVELFFFDNEFGITPPAATSNSAPNSPEYPLWRKRVAETVELEPGDPDAPQVTFVELADAHFRTDSALVLPEGEDPDAKGEHRALTSVGLIAQALRFNEEHTGRSAFVAGHTDTSAGDAHNDELSKLRAQLALALLEGDRESFKTVADQRHKPADVNQILSWVSKAFPELQAPPPKTGPAFDCDPGKITDVVNQAKVRKFQAEYNAIKSSLGVTTPDISVDGSVGKETWGAFFDCYEFALQQELGEDVPGLATLRNKLQFVDGARKALGFGERFPIEELGVDNFRSQTNRRVEILFFEPGEEPDLAHAEDDPETSELYLPGFFERTPLEPMLSAKPFTATWDAPTASINTTRRILLDAPGLPAGTALAIDIRLVGGGSIATLTAASAEGAADVPFVDWDAPEDVPFVGELQPGQEFPPSLVEYVIEGGGRRVQTSTPLTYADNANMLLTLDDEGDPRILANEKYVLCTPFGRRQGVTDAQGALVESNLPIGGGLLALRGRHLVHALVLDHGWDGEDVGT